MPDQMITLTSEQVALLSAIVEASKAAREEFYILRTMQGSFLRHSGLAGGHLDVYGPDFQALEDLGFFTVTHYDSRTGKSSAFDISPLGRQAFNAAHTQAVSPAEAVENDLRNYLETDAFRQDHPAAYERWSSAAELLWAEDANGPLTEVGHFCREALQEFATVLVAKTPVEADTKKTDTVARLRSVVQECQASTGKTSAAMFDAMLCYWGTVSDLAQRQEHAASRIGKPLEWEDARRLVFQTLVVMCEIDRIVSRCRGEH
jgi:hypothetical protein